MLDDWKNCHTFPKIVVFALLLPANAYISLSHLQILSQDHTVKEMLSQTTSKSESLSHHFEEKMLVLHTKKNKFKLEMSYSCVNEYTVSMFNVIHDSNKIILSKRKKKQELRIYPV